MAGKESGAFYQRNDTKRSGALVSLQLEHVLASCSEHPGKEPQDQLAWP